MTAEKKIQYSTQRSEKTGQGQPLSARPSTVLSELWPDQGPENVTYNDTNTVQYMYSAFRGGGTEGPGAGKLRNARRGNSGVDIQYNRFLRLKVPVRRDWFGRKASKPSGLRFLSKCQRNRDDDGLEPANTHLIRVGRTKQPRARASGPR